MSSQLKEDELLLNLSNSIGTNIDILGLKLDFSGTQITIFKKNNNALNQVSTAGTHMMLQRWRQRKTSLVWRGELCQCLIDAGMKMQAEEFFPDIAGDSHDPSGKAVASVPVASTGELLTGVSTKQSRFSTQGWGNRLEVTTASRDTDDQPSGDTIKPSVTYPAYFDEVEIYANDDRDKCPGKYDDYEVESANPVGQKWDRRIKQSYETCTSRQKGMAVIFNYERFVRPDLTTRTWSKPDEVNVRKLLSRLGYVVDTYKDLTSKETESMVDLLLARSENQLSVVLFISSHGDRYGFFSTDGYIFTDDILRKFERRLMKKPKLVFIDACMGVDVTNPIYGNDGGTQSLQNLHPWPENADVFLINSTTPGKTAWSDKDGSWFVQKLCEVLYNHAHEDDLVELMRKVTSELHTQVSPDKTGKETTQSLTFTSVGVTKQFFFFPGFPALS